jgi:hypothetical protein
MVIMAKRLPDKREAIEGAGVAAAAAATCSAARTFSRAPAAMA